MNDIDEAVKRYEAGDAWDDASEVVEADVRRPLDKVIPIRLGSDQWEALRTEARARDVGPSTLARTWLLDRLALQAAFAGPFPSAAAGEEIRLLAGSGVPGMADVVAALPAALAAAMASPVVTDAIHARLVGELMAAKTGKVGGSGTKQKQR